MRKQERLERIIAGEKPDRIPVALWRHWPGDDQRYADLARSIIDFQHDYNWDFVRIMPSTNFQVVDYGVQDDWNGNLHGTREISKRTVTRSLEWTEIRSLTPDRGMLGQQVECTRLICSAMEAEGTPVIQTIYSPFAQAVRLGGKDQTLRNMRTHPDRLRTGLNLLTESTLRFIEALWRIPSIAGIFLVTEFANYETMSETEYASFAMPYNMKILESLPERWWFNVVQIQGSSPMIDLFRDLPTHVLNWDTRSGHPNLARVGGQLSQTVCGGLSDWKDLHQGTPSSIQDAVRQAFQETRGSKFILSNSGAGYITMPIANIRAVRSIVESITI